MAVKPKGKNWTVTEQIIEDLVSGLTFQFEVGKDGLPRLNVFGALPFGNRMILFGLDGAEAGSGTALTGLCRASWLRVVD